MVVVDTTVWVDYINGADKPACDWLDREIDLQRIGLTDLTLCELLQGVREEAKADALHTSMMRFVLIPTGGEALAVASAKNYRKLRSKGVTVRKTIDCLIATCCLVQGHSLLHNDRDFDGFEKHLGLRVIHPWKVQR